MQLFHVLNRGVDGRNIFMEDDDRVRFVHDMFEFNDTRPANNTNYACAGINNDFVSRYSAEAESRPLVAIHAWCLMPNHYHLLLSEIEEGGVAHFARKLNVGYAKFVNDKYKRKGTLFQGRTKKIPIIENTHFWYIVHYIHLNALDHHEHMSNWRGGAGVADVSEAMRLLEDFRWSSFLDYAGKKNFPSILSRALYDDLYPDYQGELRKFLGESSLVAPLTPKELE